MGSGLRAHHLALLAALLGPLGARAASADDASGASPPAAAGPSHAASPSQNLDEWLAYVAGEQITRRMIVRQIGEKTEGESDAKYEQSVRKALSQRVVTGALVWRARQFGLEIKPDVVDEVVASAGKEEVDRAKARGIDLTFPEILRRRGQSLEEFKELLARDLLVRNYWRILMRGMPGKRAQFDPEPSPADCARLYAAHRAAFDQHAGVRLAQFSGRPIDYLEKAADYTAAVEMAKSTIRGYASEVVAGTPADKVAEAHKIEGGDFGATPEKVFLEKGQRPLPGPIEAWAFDPARKRGDIEVFDAGPGTVASFAVLEVRPARNRSYDELLPDLMELIRRVRGKRFQMQHMLEVFASAPVKPTALVLAISDQLREEQKGIDEDPVTRDIKMR